MVQSGIALPKVYIQLSEKRKFYLKEREKDEENDTLVVTFTEAFEFCFFSNYARELMIFSQFRFFLAFFQLKGDDDSIWK